MTKTCYFCLSVEHDDMVGLASVNPKFENKWFCSTYCLYTHKESGTRMKRRKPKVIDEKRDDQF